MATNSDILCRLEDRRYGHRVRPERPPSGADWPGQLLHVDDIKGSLQTLLDAGAQLLQAAKDVGGGGLTASVKDGNGNMIGLLQDPSK